MSTPMNHNDGVPMSKQNAPAMAGGPAPQGGYPGGPQPGPGGPGPMPMGGGAPAHARLPQPLSPEGGDKPIGFGRLFVVELRKMIDTRAGKWLLASALGLMVLISVGFSFSSSMKERPEFGTYLGMDSLALKFILPVIGIMAVTSEWSQRTGLVTFALEPRRLRVGLAKWLAALVLGAVVIAFAVAFAALMTVLLSTFTGHDADWSFGADKVAWFALVFLIFVSMGVAFGLLIQNTPAAICAFLFIPIAFSILTSLPAIRTVGEWADPNQSLFYLIGDDADRPANLVGKVLVSLGLWLALPMVLGLIRLQRREVKSS